MSSNAAVRLQNASSIFIHVERLDSHALNLLSTTDLAVYCTLGEKQLKTAAAPVLPTSVDAVEFDSLLQFPLDPVKDTSVLFQLKERMTQKELGRCVLDLDIFADNDKPSHLVRIKLKHHEKGVGYLDMKVKISDVVLDKASAAKYIKHPKQTGPMKSTQVPDLIPGYDPAVHTTRHCKVTIYKIQNILSLNKELHLIIRLGGVELKVKSPKGCENDRDKLTAVFDRTAHIPYQGHRFIHFTLQGSPLPGQSPLTLASGEMDLLDFVTKRANVFTGCLRLEAAEEQSGGQMFVRLERCQQPIQNSFLTEEVDFFGVY